MRRAAHALCVGLLTIAAVLALAGCQRKVELQLAADVRQASEIESALGAAGIEVERRSQKAGVMLYVARAELSRAVHRLREAGLLRPSRASVDEVLGKRGIAQTPLEERVRRIHVIERELEATLMDIDGVVTARVRIVPPERHAPGAPMSLASASVLVTHRAGVDLTPLMPAIARLVKHGAPGLAGEDDRRIAVVLVPEPANTPAQAVLTAGDPAAGDPAAGDPAAGDPAGIIAAGSVVGRSALGLIPWVLSSAAIGYFLDRLRRRVLGRRSNGGKNGNEP
jgi:type III secretion protein J